jgi:hypothetical protein
VCEEDECAKRMTKERFFCARIRGLGLYSRGTEELQKGFKQASDLSDDISERHVCFAGANP